MPAPIRKCPRCISGQMFRDEAGWTCLQCSHTEYTANGAKLMRMTRAQGTSLTYARPKPHRSDLVSEREAS